MNRELQDYIKTGEFTFCGICGRNVCYGNKDYTCNSCMRSLFSLPLSPQEYQEFRLKIRYEEEISSLIRKHRKELAEMRKEVINLTQK